MLAQQQVDDVWRYYWSGGGSMQMELPGPVLKHEHFDSGEIWEYLIEGRIDRCVVRAPRLSHRRPDAVAPKPISIRPPEQAVRVPRGRAAGADAAPQGDRALSEQTTAGNRARHAVGTSRSAGARGDRRPSPTSGSGPRSLHRGAERHAHRRPIPRLVRGRRTGSQPDLTGTSAGSRLPPFRAISST